MDFDGKVLLDLFPFNHKPSSFFSSDTTISKIKCIMFVYINVQAFWNTTFVGLYTVHAVLSLTIFFTQKLTIDMMWKMLIYLNHLKTVRMLCKIVTFLSTLFHLKVKYI